MSERFVTTIGEIGLLVDGPVGAPPRRASPSPGGNRSVPKGGGRKGRGTMTDGIGSLMGIGEEDPTDDGGFDVPVLVPPIGPALAIPEPDAQGESTPSSPRAVPYVRSAWLPDGRYTLQPGNTLWGLAVSYMGAGSRYREIWAVQPASYKASRTPDRIRAGDVIAMPEDAQKKARSLGFIGIGSGLGQAIGVPMGFSKKQAAIAAGVVGGGALLWLLNR
jgi:hypothetical protein